MKAIICIDDKNGMMFHNRRQTKDSAVRKDIAEIVSDSHIWMNFYSAEQFQSDSEGLNIMVDENFIDKVNNDYCFVEDILLKPYIAHIEQMILYHWNRQYPADLYLDIDVSAKDWEMIYQKEIIGTSHENIRRETFIHKR